MAFEDDGEKLSFAERDKRLRERKKDGRGGGRRDVQTLDRRKRGMSKRYKSALDQLWKSGKLEETVRTATAGPSDDSAPGDGDLSAPDSREGLLAAIDGAATKEEKSHLAARFIRTYGTPEDHRVLVPLVGYEDADIHRKALAKLKMLVRRKMVEPTDELRADLEAVLDGDDGRLADLAEETLRYLG